MSSKARARPPRRKPSRRAPSPARESGPGEAPRRSALDLKSIRADFPILSRRVHGKPLVYLDNAATSQKPKSVIQAIERFYRTENANIHRGVYTLSEEATALYEATRAKGRRFLNAREDREVIFTRGTTDGVNLVAGSFGRANVRQGDEVLISVMEHHSNIVPWQILCEEKGATLKVIPINPRGELLLEDYRRLLSPRTRIVAVAHVSNSLGTINPVREITAIAHARGIPVLVDGAQAAPHLKIDVQDLDVDFYTVSGHKMFGPTGSGFLYGKAERLEAMPPYQGGGDMIRSVTFARTTYAPIPSKFEAGTPDIDGVVGLGAAIDYLETVDWAAASAHEADLLTHATKALSAIPGVTIIGTAARKASVISFVIDGVHAHDVGTILDKDGVAVRTGHHCTQPLMDFFGVPATARASMAFYNTREEVDALVSAVKGVREVFA